MKKLLVTLDDDLAKELDKFPNKSQIVREALKIYNEHISTDTVEGLRQSYDILRKFMGEKFEVYDESFRRMDKLIEYIESRMM